MGGGWREPVVATGTPDSLVVIALHGFIRKRRRFYDFAGHELSGDELSAKQARERDAHARLQDGPKRPVSVMAQEENLGPPGNATGWFKDASTRRGPNTPSDFNLFEIPLYSLDEWARRVSAEPHRAQCTALSISNLGRVTKTLFAAIKRDHALTSGEAVKLFDKYLGAACPKCLGGLTGDVLQMVSAGVVSAGVVGGGAQFQRILAGRCANCESDTYYVVWHGDRSSP
jgi:hypothetical protein